VRLWWEIARRAFARQAAYGVAAAAGVFTNTFFGFVRAYVLVEVHRHHPGAGHFDVRQAVTFVFVTQAMIPAVGTFGWFDLAERVRTGMVAIDLYRPVDLQAYELSLGFGRAAYFFVARGFGPIAIGAIAFSIVLAPLRLVPAVAVSLVLAVLVGLALGFLANLAAFWILDWAGVGALTIMVGTLLCGLALPLNYFPHPYDSIVRALPWAATMQLPVEMVVGVHRGAADIAGVLATQAAWAVALLALGRVVLARATRKLVVQGG
jgi:ABC-2 type transport system permease protein